MNEPTDHIALLYITVALIANRMIIRCVDFPNAYYTGPFKNKKYVVLFKSRYIYGQ